MEMGQGKGIYCQVLLSPGNVKHTVVECNTTHLCRSFDMMGGVTLCSCS